MLTKLWKEELRANLHKPSAWSPESSEISLLYVPTGAGFCGPEQLKTFTACFPAASHLFNEAQLCRSENELQSLSCVVSEDNWCLTEDFLLCWTQQGVKVPWLLPGVSFPLRRFELPFTVHAQLCPESQKLLRVRVHWDQAVLLKQISSANEKLLSEFSLLSAREVSKRLLGPLTAELMNPLSPLPAPLKKSTSLNSLGALVAELPSASELAVTPKMPSRSRSINPALLSSMRLGAEEDDANDNDSKEKPRLLTDSPAPAHVRSVKSRVFDQDPLQYRPIMSAGKDHNASNVFDSTPQPYQPILPVDKKRFESRVFGNDADDDVDKGTTIVHVGNAQPLQESHLIAPEEDLKLGLLEGPNASLARPQMQGHFKGAQLGETVPSASPCATQQHPSNLIDPNKSQINFSFNEVDENAPPCQNSFHLTKGAAFNPNRSQIVFDFDEPQAAAPVKPSSRVVAPPGGHSTIEL